MNVLKGTLLTMEIGIYSRTQPTISSLLVGFVLKKRCQFHHMAIGYPFVDLQSSPILEKVLTLTNRQKIP